MMVFKRTKDFIPARSPKFVLHKLLSSLEPERPISVVHASDVTKDGGICARMYALADATKAKFREQHLSASKTVTFEIGHMLEAKIVEWFADAGIARTSWRCLSCGSMTAFVKRPEKCHCECTQFKAENYRFLSSKTGISASIDCFLDFGDGSRFKCVEIKSIDKDEFKSLVAPLAEHRLRTALYMRTIAESTDPNAKFVDTSSAWVIYTTKGGYGTKDLTLAKLGFLDGFSPFKEFEIKRADRDLEEMVGPAREIKSFREKKTGMPAPICASTMGARAKECQLRKVCFSGDYPSNVYPPK